ncbi:MAG TPA: DUF6326 family protein [Methanocella sp.]|nr:DUF6326 family protein [Methanocella sp.]
MEDVKITLAVLWAALMLTYLLGDVLRIYSGDYRAGELVGRSMTQLAWLGVAVLMVIPIIMLVLTIILDNPVNRWANIVAAIFFFGFNIIGLPTYPSAFDKFLIAVSLGLNALTVWYAWNWA